MMNHYFNPDGYYTHSLPASPGTMPPANACRDPLPAALPGQWPKFENGKWVMVPDLRETEFWYPDGTTGRVDEIGECLPPGVMVTPPPTPNHTEHNGIEWLLNKGKLIVAVKENRKKALDAGFLVDGVLWDSDINARVAYQEVGTVFAADSGYEVLWKTSGTNWVTLDSSLYSKVVAAGQQHIADCFAWEQAKNEEINAAQNTELGSVSIIFGE